MSVSQPADSAADAVESPPVGTGQLYLVLYPKGLDDQVVSHLEALGVPGFTEFPKLIGRGQERHYDSMIWPGATGAIVTVVGEAEMPRVDAGLRALDRNLRAERQGHHRLHVFSWTCRQLL